MRTKHFFLFLFLFIYLSAQAQLLWEVKAPRSKNVSYIFGTHHLISADYLKNIPKVFNAFNASETVVGEIVLNNIDFTSKMQTMAMMPKDTTYNDLLNDEDYELVNAELLKTFKIGLKELGALQPQLILTLYTAAMHKSLSESENENYLDSYFQHAATEKGKEVMGLESVDEQIDMLFKGFSLKRQAQLLVETLKNRDNALQEVKKLNELYKTGNLDALYNMAKAGNNSFDFNAFELNRMLDQRNIAWVETLDSLLREKSCFVAVGALHLPGEQGIIKLLRKKGFKVKALR
jgi:uncharacterized protein